MSNNRTMHTRHNFTPKLISNVTSKNISPKNADSKHIRISMNTRSKKTSLFLKTAFCLVLAGAGLNTMSQDLDYPDYRSKKDNFSKIADKDVRADVASFSLAAVDESIGKAQLQGIPVKEYGSDYMTYEGNNIQVTIKTGVFFPSKHKMNFMEGHLVRIDNHPYYGGTYGNPPKTTIESVLVIVGKDTVSIPPAAFSDLYDPSFSYNEAGATRSRNGVFLSNDKHTFYIYMFNPLSKGSEYTWVIRDKQYLRRVVDFGFLN